jgi:hypothetical protein
MLPVGVNTHSALNDDARQEGDGPLVGIEPLVCDRRARVPLPVVGIPPLWVASKGPGGVGGLGCFARRALRHWSGVGSDCPLHLLTLALLPFQLLLW